LRYFRRHDFEALDPFAYYCWAAGAIALGLLLSWYEGRSFHHGGTEATEKQGTALRAERTARSSVTSVSSVVTLCRCGHVERAGDGFVAFALAMTNEDCHCERSEAIRAGLFESRHHLAAQQVQ